MDTHGRPTAHSCINPIRKLVAMALFGNALWGCAGNPLETNNVTKDGTIYRETEITEDGASRATIKVRGATF